MPGRWHQARWESGPIDLNPKIAVDHERRLRTGVAFDWIVTAQQVRSYKPDERNFAALFERLAPDGVRPERILHVAQSLFHDHAPAKRLGLTTVWIDRRHGRPGSGATPAPEARPDATFASMADFARAAVPLPRPMKARGRSLRI